VDPREWPMGVPKRANATFGVPKGTYKPDPKAFTKKHAGEITLPDRTPLPAHALPCIRQLTTDPTLTREADCTGDETHTVVRFA
jgi:hypothetical protein